MEEEVLVTVDDIAEDAPPIPVKRRRGRPRKHPLPEDVQTDATVESAPKRRGRRSTKLTTDQVAEAIMIGTAVAADMRGTPFWAYSAEEAKQWCFPLTDLLNRLPDRWIKHSSMGVGITFAAMAFWRQTKPRLEAERHFQAQRREHEHTTNGQVNQSEMPLWQPHA